MGTELKSVCRKATPTLDESDDIQLWKAVAEKRDGHAFAQLYNRNEQAAYNLAFHITRNQADAEEAVQEALVRAWKSADAFRGEGTVRAWLLRIVARESLRKIQVLRKDARVKANHEPLEDADMSTASEPERGELIDALRGQLELLPILDRELLALHFGGGLTQDEISSALECSQQTVSLRIQKALGHLRTKLSVAGFAAVVPLLEAKRLQEAFHGGFSVPPNLAGKVVGKFAAVAKVGARKAIPFSTSSIIVMALVAASAAGFYYFNNQAGSTAKAPRDEVHRESDPVREYTLTLQEGQPVRELGLAKYAGAKDASIYFNEPTHQSMPVLYVWQGWFSLISFAVFANEGGPLPDNAEIIEAKLSIFELDDVSEEQLALYPILAPWKSNEVSWDYAAAKVKWKTPGGESDEKAAALFRSQRKKNVWCEFDITESLSRARKEGKNFGWALTTCVNGKRNNWAGGCMRFAPSYSADLSARPKLILKVRCPKVPNEK